MCGERGRRGDRCRRRDSGLVGLSFPYFFLLELLLLVRPALFFVDDEPMDFFAPLPLDLVGMLTLPSGALNR